MLYAFLTLFYDSMKFIHKLINKRTLFSFNIFLLVNLKEVRALWKTLV